MRPIRLHDPRTTRHLAMGVILVGGILAGTGTLLRDLIEGHGDQWTFLLDTVGLLVAVCGAAFDFRSSARFGPNELPGGRRRAILQLMLGTLATITGCYSLGWVNGDAIPVIVRAVLSAGMTAGIGMALAGLLYIGWFGGGDHLERRIAQRVDEEW
jgi:hypothetical protein